MRSRENLASQPEPESPQARRQRELLAMKSGRRPDSTGRDWLPRPSREETRARRADKARSDYLRDNPGDLEGAEVVAGLFECLENDRRLAAGEIKSKEERLNLLQDLTEFNFLWTHYLQTINNDPAAVEDLWQRLETIARNERAETAYNKRRSGILSQAAIMTILSELGLHPALAKPVEDAFRKTDLWLEEAPVQIKTDSKSDELKIIRTEANTGAPLHAVIEAGGRQVHLASGELAEAAKFQLKLDQYARDFNKPSLAGFFMVIPRSQIDRATGKPTEKLKLEVRAKLQELGYLPAEQEQAAA